MQIKEVSEKTGLTIKTIRFYEERGLITPKLEWRNGRNYRDYRKTDVEQLQMVAVLRKCLFSIDQILTMLQHPELTPDVFEEYRDMLLSQRELLNLLADRAEHVDSATLKDPETLARRLTTTARPLPLPVRDVNPNFGQFDPETPEERQIAYVKWQKRYRYRHLRWAVPLGLTVLLLAIVTVIYAGRVRNQTIEAYRFVETCISEADFTELGAKETSEYSHLYPKYVLQHTTFGLYNQQGALLPVLTEGNYINIFETAPEGDLAAESRVEDVVYMAFSPWGLSKTAQLRSHMAEWTVQHSVDGRTLSSGLLRQRIASSIPIHCDEGDYTLVLYLEQSPLLVAFSQLMLLYLCVAGVWFVVFAISSTQGYGFKVQFIRNYGLRNNWNDAILSVDEENGNATMLTHQYTGMENLVSMDYHREE